MKESEFKSKMLYAESMKKLDERPYYWEGYVRGLRRRYHGEKFGTAEEHTLWMDSINRPDESRSERGRGYRDGIAEITLKPMFCLRCTYQWLPRSTGLPTICPHCKSPYWNKPKSIKNT
jgi:hypothetical protein